MNLTARIEVEHLPATILDDYGSMSTYALVFIAIVNPLTGELTDGNNCTVTYTVDDGGNITTRQVTVSGMRQLVYKGEVSRVIFNSNHIVTSSSYKNFNIKSLTGGSIDTPKPIPQQSHLQIISITVNQPESAPGAKNGRITVNATSDYLPLTYKLNDTLTSASPVFTELTGGNYTITVFDAADNAKSQDVFVPTLSSLLQSAPAITLPGNNISRWNAAFNPVVFTYQRKDFDVTRLELNTADGNTRVFINKDVSAVLAGDLIYLSTEICTGTYKVLSKYSDYTLVIDTPFKGNGTGFININRLKPYYKLLTRITYDDQLTGQESTITSQNRPDNTGVIKANISNFLQSLLRPTDESDYALQNFRDANLSASYKVAYAEKWDNDTAEGFTTAYHVIEEPFYVIYAAKQLGERFGGNLADYVPFASTPAGADKAKWITDFKEPAFSNGYPFDIAFIYSEDMIGRNVYAEFTLLDINRNALPGGLQTGYLLNDDGSWLLNNDGGKMIIAGQSTTIPIPQQLGLNRLLIEGPFPGNAYYINVVLKYDDDEDITHTLTQTQTIRIDDAVDDQSVYLRWIGLSGSWNYYRFVMNQEISLDVQNAVIIKNYVSDWQNQEGIDEVISKSAGQKMKVMAEDLSVNDVKGLQSIKYSPKVQMLVNRNPVKWQTIVINTATYSEYETRNGQAPFSITFNLPAINIQAQ
ncbi:hypothetical protein ACFQZX_04045 [Mucilaginibacter litoreus]|uniref:Uncharacterized protein n=1 Tax=Mucilaginibacter litoreus TaxID=1048221 RepID=A0ABW3AP71_9SPHI